MHNNLNPLKSNFFPSPRLSKLRKLTQFFRNNSCQLGASLIEFAIIFPIFITIILSIFEMGIMLTIKVNMQSCVMTGASYGATGAYTSGSTRIASAQTAITNAMSSILNPANVTMTLESFPTFAIANLGGAGSPGTGSPGQVGMYKMQYAYSPSSPLIAAFFGGTKILKATSYTKNEGTFPS